MTRRLDRWIKALLVVNIVFVALLLGAVAVDSFTSQPAGHPAQAVPSPSASADTMPMGLAHIPTSNSCVLCHEEGGSAGLKPVPALGHPLEGWTSCLTCHTDEKLGRAAPGHNGIEESECLTCHRLATEGPPITQAHSEIEGQECLDCHGDFAHLPSSMVGRNTEECWLCHKPAPSPPPLKPHPDVARLTCRSCHQSATVGGLPIDHALRTDETCVLCHTLHTASPSAGGSPQPTAPVSGFSGPGG